MVFIVTKAALAATIVGVGVTFGALSYLARRGQENNENGLLSSKFNKFNPDGTSSLGRGYPSISLFTTSSENDPSPGSSLHGNSPLFSFPTGFRLFGGGGSSTLSSLFLRDCNCKLIHECSTFFGGASQSFRLRRTCGFEGFQRKICCDEGPFFSTPPPNLALDEVKSAHAHINSNSKELPCAHNHDPNGGISGCNCAHFQQDEKDAGNKDANTANDEGSGTTPAGEAVVTTTTTRRPAKINFPNVNEYFRDDPPVDSEDGTPQAFPFEVALFPNEGGNGGFDSKDRNDRIDAAFGEDGESTTGKGVLMNDGTVFPSLNNFFQENKFPQIDVRTSLTTQPEAIDTASTTKSSQDSQGTLPNNDSGLPVSTTEKIDKNDGDKIDDISGTPDSPKPLKFDAIDITEAPESTIVKKDLQTSTMPSNEEFPDVTESILHGSRGGTQSPQNLEFDHSLVNVNEGSPTVPPSEESAQTGTSSQVEISSTLKEKEEGASDALSSTVSNDRRPFALTGASDNINDFNEKVTTLNSVPEGDGDNDKGISTTLSSSQSERIPSQVSTTHAIDATISDDNAQTSTSSSSSMTEESGKDQNDEIIPTTVNSVRNDDDDVDGSKSTSENMGQIDTVTTTKPDVLETISPTDNTNPEIEELTTPGITTPLPSQDYLVSSTISSDIPIPATTEKENISDQLDDEQPTTTIMPAQSSPSPIDSQTLSPIDSQTLSPIDSQTLSPIDSQTLSPIDSQTLSPIDSQTLSPIDSQTLSPIDSQTVPSVDSQTVSPADSPTVSPADSSTVSPVDSQTVSPADSPTVSPADSSTVSPVDSQTVSLIDSQTLSPIDSQTLSPIDSQTLSPIDSQTLSPIDSQTLSPIDSQTVSPADSPTVSPADSPTVSPVDSQTVSLIDSQTSLPIDSETLTPVDSQTSSTVSQTGNAEDSTTTGSVEKHSPVPITSEAPDTETTPRIQPHAEDDSSTKNPVIDQSLTTTIQSLFDDIVDIFSALTTTTSPERNPPDEMQSTTISSKADLDQSTTLAASNEELDTKLSTNSSDVSEGNNVVPTTPSEEEQQTTTISSSQTDTNFSDFPTEQDYSINELPTARKVATPSVGQSDKTSPNGLTDDAILKSTTVMPGSSENKIPETVPTTERTALVSDDTTDAGNMMSTANPEQDEVTAGTLKIIEIPATTPMSKITTTAMPSQISDDETTTGQFSSGDDSSLDDMTLRTDVAGNDENMESSTFNPQTTASSLTPDKDGQNINIETTLSSTLNNVPDDISLTTSIPNMQISDSSTGIPMLDDRGDVMLSTTKLSYEEATFKHVEDTAVLDTMKTIMDDQSLSTEPSSGSTTTAPADSRDKNPENEDSSDISTINPSVLEMRQDEQTPVSLLKGEEDSTVAPIESTTMLKDVSVTTKPSIGLSTSTDSKEKSNSDSETTTLSDSSMTNVPSSETTTEGDSSMANVPSSETTTSSATDSAAYDEKGGSSTFNPQNTEFTTETRVGSILENVPNDISLTTSIPNKQTSDDSTDIPLLYDRGDVILATTELSIDKTTFKSISEESFTKNVEDSVVVGTIKTTMSDDQSPSIEPSPESTTTTSSTESGDKKPENEDSSDLSTINPSVSEMMQEEQTPLSLMKGADDSTLTPIESTTTASTDSKEKSNSETTAETEPSTTSVYSSETPPVTDTSMTDVPSSETPPGVDSSMTDVPSPETPPGVDSSMTDVPSSETPPGVDSSMTDVPSPETPPGVDSSMTDVPSSETPPGVDSSMADVPSTETTPGADSDMTDVPSSETETRVLTDEVAYDDEAESSTFNPQTSEFSTETILGSTLENGPEGTVTTSIPNKQTSDDSTDIPLLDDRGDVLLSTTKLSIDKTTFRSISEESFTKNVENSTVVSTIKTTMSDDQSPSIEPSPESTTTTSPTESPENGDGDNSTINPSVSEMRQEELTPVSLLEGAHDSTLTPIESTTMSKDLSDTTKLAKEKSISETTAETDSSTTSLSSTETTSVTYSSMTDVPSSETISVTDSSLSEGDALTTEVPELGTIQRDEIGPELTEGSVGELSTSKNSNLNYEMATTPFEDSSSLPEATTIGQKSITDDEASPTQTTTGTQDEVTTKAIPTDMESDTPMGDEIISTTTVKNPASSQDVTTANMNEVGTTSTTTESQGDITNRAGQTTLHTTESKLGDTSTQNPTADTSNYDINTTENGVLLDDINNESTTITTSATTQLPELEGMLTSTPISVTPGDQDQTTSSAELGLKTSTLPSDSATTIMVPSDIAEITTQQSTDEESTSGTEMITNDGIPSSTTVKSSAENTPKDTMNVETTTVESTTDKSKSAVVSEEGTTTQANFDEVEFTTTRTISTRKSNKNKMSTPKSAGSNETSDSSSGQDDSTSAPTPIQTTTESGEWVLESEEIETTMKPLESMPQFGPMYPMFGPMQQSNDQMSPFGPMQPLNNQMSPFGPMQPPNDQMSPFGPMQPSNDQMSPFGPMPFNGSMNPFEHMPFNGSMYPFILPIYDFDTNGREDDTVMTTTLKPKSSSGYRKPPPKKTDKSKQSPLMPTPAKSGAANIAITESTGTTISPENQNDNVDYNDQTTNIELEPPAFDIEIRTTFAPPEADSDSTTLSTLDDVSTTNVNLEDQSTTMSPQEEKLMARTAGRLVPLPIYVANEVAKVIEANVPTEKASQTSGDSSTTQPDNLDRATDMMGVEETTPSVADEGMKTTMNSLTKPTVENEEVEMVTTESTEGITKQNGLPAEETTEKPDEGTFFNYDKTTTENGVLMDDINDESTTMTSSATTEQSELPEVVEEIITSTPTSGDQDQTTSSAELGLNTSTLPSDSATTMVVPSDITEMTTQQSADEESTSGTEMITNNGIPSSTTDKSSVENTENLLQDDFRDAFTEQATIRAEVTTGPPQSLVFNEEDTQSEKSSSMEKTTMTSLPETTTSMSPGENHDSYAATTEYPDSESTSQTTAAYVSADNIPPGITASPNSENIPQSTAADSNGDTISDTTTDTPNAGYIPPSPKEPLDDESIPEATTVSSGGTESTLSDATASPDSDTTPQADADTVPESTTKIPGAGSTPQSTDNLTTDDTLVFDDEQMEVTSTTPGPTSVPMTEDEIIMDEDGLPVTEITKSIRREPDTDKTVVELTHMTSKEKNKVGKTVTAVRTGSETSVSELTTESPESTTTGQSEPREAHKPSTDVPNIDAKWTRFQPETTTEVPNIATELTEFQPETTTEVPNADAELTEIQPETTTEVPHIDAEVTGFQPETTTEVPNIDAKWTRFQPETTTGRIKSGESLIFDNIGDELEQTTITNEKNETEMLMARTAGSGVPLPTSDESTTKSGKGAKDDNVVFDIEELPDSGEDVKLEATTSIPLVEKESIPTTLSSVESDGTTKSANYDNVVFDLDGLHDSDETTTDGEGTAPTTLTSVESSATAKPVNYDNVVFDLEGLNDSDEATAKPVDTADAIEDMMNVGFEYNSTESDSTEETRHSSYLPPSTSRTIDIQNSPAEESLDLELPVAPSTELVPANTESVMINDFNHKSSSSDTSVVSTDTETEPPTTQTYQDTTVPTALLEGFYETLFGPSGRSARVNNLGSGSHNYSILYDTPSTTGKTTTTPEPPFEIDVKVESPNPRYLFSSDTTPEEIKLKAEISNVVNQLLLTTHKNFNLLPNFVECAGARGRTGRRKTKVLHFDTDNYPWMARIGFKEPGGVLFPCAGTIISRRYILTSAQCALRKANGTASIMEILLEGAKNAAMGVSDQGQYKYKVEQVLPHPNYDARTRENDLALIRLAREIPSFNGSSDVKPICLPFEDGYGVWDSLPGEGETAYLGGWGYGLKNMAAKVEEMEDAAVTIWSNENCTHLYRGDRMKKITQNNICAYGKAEKDACRGDSGGPLMALMTRQRIFFQIGVVSYGPRCGYGVPGVYTRISYYLSWILDSMQP